MRVDGGGLSASSARRVWSVRVSERMKSASKSAGQTFMALAGRPWMDETRGRRPLTPVTLIAAASAKVRLALELRGTLDCRDEHESQIL